MRHCFKNKYIKRKEKEKKKMHLRVCKSTFLHKSINQRESVMIAPMQGGEARTRHISNILLILP
jgi:hypothetical protein